jgi:L-ascorbate metabolism protein UlaG (beta-lactamase superfamily)
MMTCGEAAVVVDGFFRDGVKGYRTLSAGLREELETAKPPYDRVRLILATHRHADHFDASSVARHLQHNPRARFVGTPQTAEAVRALHPDRVQTVIPPADVRSGEGEARFYALPHNTPHRTAVENTAYVIRMCEETIFVSGDAEMSVEDFRKLPLKGVRINAAVLPVWFTTAPEGRRVIEEIVRPGRVYAVHRPEGSENR